MHLLAFRAPIRLERNCGGRRANSCEGFQDGWGREPGREAWQVANAGNTQSLV